MEEVERERERERERGHRSPSRLRFFWMTHFDPKMIFFIFGISPHACVAINTVWTRTWLCHSFLVIVFPWEETFKIKRQTRADF